MKLTIELDREVDGRWIVEVPELNILFIRGFKVRRYSNERSQPRGRSSSIGLRTASCLPIPRTRYSTSPHELLAFGEGASRFRRA